MALIWKPFTRSPPSGTGCCCSSVERIVDDELAPLVEGETRVLLGVVHDLPHVRVERPHGQFDRSGGGEFGGRHRKVAVAVVTMRIERAGRVEHALEAPDRPPWRTDLADRIRSRTAQRLDRRQQVLLTPSGVLRPHHDRLTGIASSAYWAVRKGQPVSQPMRLTNSGYSEPPQACAETLPRAATDWCIRRAASRPVRRRRTHACGRSKPRPAT